MKIIIGDKIVRQGAHGILHFGEVTRSQLDESTLLARWNDNSISGDPLLPRYNNHNNIWLYDRTLKNGDRVRHQGNDGSVCSTKKLITVQLLEQHHLHTYRDLDREVVTEVDYVDPPFPSSGTILPQLNEHTLQPVLKFQVGDSMMHKGWVGVVINGKVSITYRFANSGKMRMTSIRELSAMSGSKIYVGLQVKQLGTPILKSGIWSGGYRPYNRLTHGRHPATVTDVRVISLQVMWVDRILQRSCDTIATTKADDGNVVEVDSEPSPPPPTELEGESILSTVFRLADPSKELGVDSIVTVRWDDRLQKNEQSWRKTFLDDLSLGPQNVATFARIEDDEPSSKKLKAVKTPIPFSRLDWVACRVIFSQTMVDVLFDDNSVQYSIPSWKITAVLPHPRMGIPDMPYPDMGYELGDVVKNLVDFEHTHYTKYGFVLRTNPLKRTVDVNWVTVLELGKSPRVQIELKEMSQYDVQPVNSYLWLKMCPQIVLAKGIFEGVILEQSIPDAKIVVKCAEGPVKSVYLHELTFLQKKVYRSLADGIYEARTLEIRPDIIPFVDYCIPNAHSVFIHEDETVQRKYRFFTSASVPNDHTFYTSRPQFHIQTRTNGIINHEELNNLNIFKNYVERELQVLRGAVLSSVDQTGEFWPIFVERVGASSERWDLLTMAVIGAEGTVYEDIPFFLDIHLPFRFWEWEISRNPGLRPLVVVRLPRVYFPNWIHPAISMENSALSYPNELLTSWKPGNAESGDVIGFLLNVAQYFSKTILCAEPHLQHTTGQVVSFCGAGRGSGRNRNDASMTDSPPAPPHENNNNNFETVASVAMDMRNGITKHEMERSRNFNETASVALMDHLHSLLCAPPSSWKEFLECHFYTALPRINARITELLKAQWAHDAERAKNAAGIIQDDVFVVNEALGSKYLIHPLSYSFTLAMGNRLNKLIHPFLQSATLPQTKV